MIDAHIMDGDLAIIRPQKSVNSGQIVAVLVEDILMEATLKIFRRKKGCVELHSANEKYQPLVYWHGERWRVKIIGKYLGVIRRS